MAIDTAEKRRSASGVGFFPLGPGVTPTVGKDQEWRQQAGWSYSGILALSSTPTEDMVVEVQLSNLSGDTDEECGVCLRLVDTSNFLAAYVDDGDNLVHLSAFVAGVETSIATAAWTAADTAEIRVIAQGSRIRVWVNFIMVIDATDATFNTAVRAGLFSRSTTAVFFENFYAQGL